MPQKHKSFDMLSECHKFIKDNNIISYQILKIEYPDLVWYQLDYYENNLKK